jgi:hypothetical protein
LRSRGQILAIFALSIFVFVGMCAVVIDIAWYWTINLRMQRAADAAALAGVVHLPGDEPTAITVALAEASKNGFVDGVDGVIVDTDIAANQDPSNPRRMRVRITGEVSTYFMRVFGFDRIPATRSSKAEYVLPVPMGSPENYYGFFGPLRLPDGPGNTGWLTPTTVPSGDWVSAANAYASDNQYATQNSDVTPYQAYGGFGVTIPAGATVEGIEVQVEARSTDSGGCRLGVELSWDGSAVTGSGWTNLGDWASLNGSDNSYTIGGSNEDWGRTWTPAQLDNTNFRVRVRYWDPGSGCTDGSTTRLDRVRVRVHYNVASATIPVVAPDGSALTPRGLWGTMHSQGSEDVNGDAYLAQYETRTSQTNPDYLPGEYYDYAVEMPPGTTGEVWVFDPVFCATASSGRYGTGDRWFGGSAATSAFYTLYSTNNTLYDIGDDTALFSSGGLFRNIQASDPTFAGPSGVSSCATGAITDPGDGRYWHNRWWRLATGLTGGTDGTIYRLRTASTDPANPSAQSSANGHNSFAFWATATGGSPRIYGLGAMEAFTPLDPGAAAEFYLAQIEAIHAGKTVAIHLWDPGDTGALDATLQILIPTPGGYSAAPLSWTSQRGTRNSDASGCNGRSGSGTSIVTNTGNNSQFNGCWVTIEIPIPANYTAPTPPGEAEPGWWKIRYIMGGSASANPAFDLTTWQVEIRGNPVHLVLP